MKKFIFGFLLGGLIFGAIGAAAVSYIATPVDFKVLVNGKEFVSDPPALEVDGRTYLPLRAIGEALGVPINWNEELRQAEVGDKPIANSTIGRYPENIHVPDYGRLFGIEPSADKNIEEGVITLYYGYGYTNSMFTDIEAYKKELEKAGFVFYLKDGELTNYVNFEKGSMVGIYTVTMDAGRIGGVYIIFNILQ